MFSDVEKWVKAKACIDCKKVKQSQPMNHRLFEPFRATKPF